MKKLNNDNYFENTEYMSVSQYKSFTGSLAFPGCESREIAKIKGEWKDEPNTAMLIGSYVDAHFSNEMEDFKNKNPQIFNKNLTLKADFKHADKIIEVAENDKLFMKFMKGETQTILTGDIFGIQWKGKLDILNIEKEYICDLKVIKSITDQIWIPEIKQKHNFVYAYGYLDQAAIYRELVYQNTGKKLHFYIAALSKEKYPDKAIIQVPDSKMDYTLEDIEIKIEHVKDVKSGKIEPERCGKCDYCRSTKKLSDIISYIDL